MQQLKRSILGSSPHVRGALFCLARSSFDGGIIPACAGSTGPCPASRGRIRDHPRMCGEHAMAIAEAVSVLGSSPHVRGALADAKPASPKSSGSSPHVRGAPGWRPSVIDVPGIIPACAGSTHHVRADRAPAQGSSPHVRGARVSGLRYFAISGIIPACAGSTMLPKSFWIPPTGSSPHVRGALLSSSAGDNSVGIIPACAGSTRRWRRPTGHARDHPRMCGEHNSALVSVANENGIIPACAGSTFGTTGVPYCAMGSSPHVRGAPLRAVKRKLVVRIIPACAGSTRTSSKLSPGGRDHPRMCGEHAKVPRVSRLQ